MWKTVKEMLTSKKFITLVLAVISALAAAGAGQIEWASALEACGALVVTYLGAQGLADFGKSSAKVTAETAAPKEEAK